MEQEPVELKRMSALRGWWCSGGRAFGLTSFKSVSSIGVDHAPINFFLLLTFVVLLLEGDISEMNGMSSSMMRSISCS